MNEFKLKGKWWLPSTPERKIYGYLNYDLRNGAHLDLLESLKKVGGKVTISSKWQTIDKIFGMANNREITLYKGAPHSLFEARMLNVFIGKHIEDVENLKIKEAEVSYTYLKEWVNKPLCIYPRKDETYNRKTIIYEYCPKERIEAQIDDLKISIEFKSNPSIYTEQGLCIEEYPVLKFYFNTAKIFKEIKQLIFSLADLLTFTVGYYSFPTKIILKTEGEKNIDYYYTLAYKGKIAENIRINKILFTLKDFPEMLNIYITNWFRIYDEYDLAYVVRSVYDRTLPFELCFVNLVEFLGKYGGGRENDFIKKEVWFDRLGDISNCILNILPEDYRSCEINNELKKKLKHIYKKTLKEKLIEVLKEPTLKELFRRLNFNSEDFVERVKSQRNKIVHLMEYLRNKIDEFYKIRNDLELLSVIFEFIILKELGFNEIQINSILNRAIDYGRYIFINEKDIEVLR